MTWKPISSMPEGVFLETKIHDADGERNHAYLKRQGNLYFMKGGMYVYYRPTHWRGA